MRFKEHNYSQFFFDYKGETIRFTDQIARFIQPRSKLRDKILNTILDE